MKYALETTKRFDREFKKLDKYTQKIIKGWIEKNLIDIENSRSIGNNLLGNHKGKWRYRIGDYRLICKIEDKKLLILALSIANRKSVY